MITIEQMVQREILCCMSSLVSTLSNRDKYPHEYADITGDLGHLIDQASELAAPVLDYEEAATQAGWEGGSDRFPFARKKTAAERAANTDNDNSPCVYTESWEDACRADGLDPYEREVFEFWAVSQWLADKLIAQSERVDTDFAGLNIWARTATGQAIGMDGCMQRIYANMMAPVEAGA